MARLIAAQEDTFARLREKLERKPFPEIPATDPPPTRWRTDTADRTTPFVEERLERLHPYYFGYSEAYWDHSVAYVDVIRLRDGAKGFPSGRDIGDLTLTLRRDPFVTVPRLERHREAAIDLFKALGKLRRFTESGEYENNLAARCLTWPDVGNTLELQVADYFSQVATNLTMDWASGYLDGPAHATLRNSVERPVEGRLRPLGRQSRLANTLGVAVMLATADGEPLLTVRSDKTAVMGGARPRLHCSASGVFEWRHLEGCGDEPPFRVLSEGMRAEIEEELGLGPDDYELIPLALARELPRGGKPQLFFAADCALSLGQIQERMKSARGKWEWVEPAELPADSAARQVLERAARMPTLAYVDGFATYEGWMAWTLFDAHRAGRPIFET